MKIYITGLPSGYEVEHLARLFYPMAPLTLTPPEPAEDCLWAEKTDTGLRVLVRQGEKSKTLEAPLPLPVEQGGETPDVTPEPEPYIDPYEAVRTYWSEDQLTQSWGPDQIVEHLFFHPVIAYPQWAFHDCGAS